MLTVNSIVIMTDNGFCVTQSESRFLIVDCMQLLTEINMPQARKILKLSLRDSDWREVDENRQNLRDTLVQIEFRFKNNKRVIQRARKLVEMYYAGPGPGCDPGSRFYYALQPWPAGGMPGAVRLPVIRPAGIPGPAADPAAAPAGCFKYFK